MSNPTCPACSLPLAEHPAGKCLNAWLAQCLGWKNLRISEFPSVAGGIAPSSERYQWTPFYSTSLDAMAEVEREIERRDLTSEYLEKLCDLTISLAHRVCSEAPSCDWCVRHATALQCCRAAIAVMSEKETPNVK